MVVGLGDSNTYEGSTNGADWIHEAGRRYNCWSVFGNVSYPGWTLASMTAQLSTAVAAQYDHPGVLVVLGGLNEAAVLDSADIVDAMHLLCDSASALGWDKILVCTYPCPGDYYNMPAANDGIRANYSAWADGLLDLAAAPYIGEAADHTDKTYWYNTTHMTYTGLYIMSDSLTKELRMLTWP